MDDPPQTVSSVFLPRRRAQVEYAAREGRIRAAADPELAEQLEDLLEDVLAEERGERPPPPQPLRAAPSELERAAELAALRRLLETTAPPALTATHRGVVRWTLGTRPAWRRVGRPR